MSDVIAEPQRRSNPDLINRIRLIDGDLLMQRDVDVIVGSIPPSLKADGHLNQAMITAAGQQIDDFILNHIYKPRSGDVFAVPPFNLPVKHIFYAVLPVWKDGIGTEDRDMLRCYRGVIELMQKMHLKSVAVPAIGTGRGKYPVKRAARYAVQGILDRVTAQIDEVRIVCNRAETYEAFRDSLITQGWAGG